MSARELLSKALAKLDDSDSFGVPRLKPLINDIQDELAKPEPEPVAWRTHSMFSDKGWIYTEEKPTEDISYEPLYAEPPKRKPQISQSVPTDELDAEMRELIADATAFRALAELPSLWQLNLMFGPYFKLDIAFGTDAGIKVVQNGHIMTNKTAALRKLIQDAQAEICKSHRKSQRD